MREALEYLRTGAATYTTNSPFLVSNSRYLNDVRLRDWVAQQSLRRNAKDHPNVADVVSLVPIIDSLQDIDKIDALFEAECKKNPAVDAWFKEKHVSKMTRESLKDYAPGTVGRMFHDYLVKYDFEPEFYSFRGPRAKGYFDYYQLRLSQSHDLEHMLGGFFFDFISEIGVTWMRMQSLFYHLSPELAGELSAMYSLLMMPQLNRTILHYPQSHLKIWESITQGDLVARTSAPIFMMKYEDVLHLPMKEAREAIGYRNVREMDMTDEAEEWMEGFRLADAAE